MLVRYKDTKAEAWSTAFNINSIGEVLTDDDSAYIRELDVFINEQWKDMSQAFCDKDIVPNNHNTHFAPPINAECKERGYNP